MGRKLIDLTGKQFGRWTVIKRGENRGKQPYWVCQCECGTIREVNGADLRRGVSKSCGCLNLESKQIDLTNQRFGKLIAIEPTEMRSGTQVVWKCKCDCGNECYIGAGNLKSGHTTSCGCLKHISYREKDLTNQHFGLLTVIEKTEIKYFTNNVWKCQCRCGNYINVLSNRLLMGKTKSCGCLGKSFGEKKIEQILIENNISFIKQKTFENCKDVNVLPFDFWVNNQYCIEFDGYQHFHPVEHFGGEAYLQYTQTHDIIKNNYCRNNNIPLIRIPYYHLNKICFDDLKLETSIWKINMEN